VTVPRSPLKRLNDAIEAFQVEKVSRVEVEVRRKTICGTLPTMTRSGAHRTLSAPSGRPRPEDSDSGDPEAVDLDTLTRAVDAASCCLDDIPSG